MNDGEGKGPQEAAPPLYRLDMEGYEAQGRSWEAFLRSRLCPSCQGRGGDGNSLVAAIQECCSRKEDFITPGMPLMEAAFRLLLARGNQPLSVDELVGEVTRLRGLGEARKASLWPLVERLLERDTFYGFLRLEGEPRA